MKLRTFFLCSVVISIMAIATILRITSTPDQAQTANSGVSQSSANSPLTTATPFQPAPVSAANPVNFPGENNPLATTDEPSSEDCLATGKPFHAGNIEVMSVKPEKGNFAYPQIVKPRTRQERKFNLYVQKLFAGDLYDFSVSYATPEFLSIDFVYETCGASCHYLSKLLNYDLKAGRPIKKLAELFKPRSGFLKTIASYSVRELKRCEGFLDDDEWFERGTKPTASNYDTWGLGRAGVEITFNEYQIAPGVYPGAIVVVPYDHLREMLRQDVAWFRRLKLKL